MKKCLVIRLGAYGDCLIITPVLKKLKKQGYHVIMMTSERGEQVLQHNPNIDSWILQKSQPPDLKCVRCDTSFYGEGSFCSSKCHRLYEKKMKKQYPFDKSKITVIRREFYSPSKERIYSKHIPAIALEKHVKSVTKNINPDKVIDFTRSIEMDIALHPIMPQYVWPKQERLVYSKINYYEHSFDHAGVEYTETDYMQPEIYLTKEENKKAKSFLKKNKFNIVWGISGSGNQKNYCHVSNVINKLKDKFHFITVGDAKCSLIDSEWNNDPLVTTLSGKLSMRESISILKYADLVIAPDTGLLHGSGCFNTPKIGLLGHTTIENITKYFDNDYSLEAKVECAPCSRITYNSSVYCANEDLVDEGGNLFGVSYCMYHGIPPEILIKQIEVVYEIHKRKTIKNSTTL